MLLTRRELGKLALTTVPAAAMVRGERTVAAWQAKPTSKIAGVQIGLNVPYNYGAARTMTGDETLRRTLELGVNAVELRSQPVEIAMGSPGFIAGAQGAQAVQLPARGAGQTERQAVIDAIRKWRASVPMTSAETFRRKWSDAGVAIEIVKFDGVYDMSDDEVEFMFRLAKALGARAISMEIARPDPAPMRRIGQFADRHQIAVGYHGHAETGPADWETAFGYAKFNGANLDIGHYVAGHNSSPIPFLEQHHARITHLHIKDRKSGTNGGANMPFGEGDTPIVEVLRLVRDNRWPMQATIEFEYSPPAGSDRMTEMKKCIEYCRTALMTS
jgi:sugar phosphate isomerase/epimerase